MSWTLAHLSPQLHRRMLRLAIGWLAIALIALVPSSLLSDDSAIPALSFMAIVVVVVMVSGLPVAGFRRRQEPRTWRVLLFPVVLLSAYALTLSLPSPGPLDDVAKNWWGLSLTALAAVMFLRAWRSDGMSRAGLGRPTEQRWWVPTLVCIGVAVPVMYGYGYVYNDGQPVSGEELLFQWTMPGVAEEIVFRGLLLLIVNEAFGRPFRLLGARYGWGAVFVALVFGLSHGLNGVVGLLFALTVGFVLTWLRERTGSVWPCIVLHNVVNGMIALGAGAAVPT
jgi:uncharacterized protein